LSMQIADEFLRKAEPVGTTEVAAHPLLIEPWMSAPPEIVVYEFGARLDVGCQAAASEQIHKARRLYNDVIGCIRGVHDQMNAWVLERAGPRAQALQAQLAACEQEIASAKVTAEFERLRLLAPQRLALGTELTSLLRPVRDTHRAEIRALFFARVGNTTNTETYQLRCQAVDEGLGWATATEALDSALLAWKKSLTLGRAPRFVDDDRKNQDTLTLQFNTKGGLPIERVLDGSNQEIHLSTPDLARRRAYGKFRFRLGLARDGVNASGTWQYHRPVPEGAQVTSARLVRRRVADKERWSLQLVLRLDEPIRLPHTPTAELAAVHFGWIKTDQGRRVATIARSADPTVAQAIVLPASIETDLARCADLQGQRAKTRDALMPRLVALVRARRQLPTTLLAELAAIGELPSNHVAFGRIYRLHKALGEIGFWRDWLDAWVREDRMRWQASVLLARRTRGRRRDFYRCVALQLARDHGAVVMEPLDLRAASRAVDESSGQWGAFTRHARAGRVVVALHEFEQAIRWACARHDTPVFELKGMTTRTCAACGVVSLAAAQGDAQRVLCAHCGAEHDRRVNAACCSWRWTHEGLETHLQVWRSRSAGKVEQTKALVEARKKAVAEKRRVSRALEAANKESP
jgi:hypothetical protein